MIGRTNAFSGSSLVQLNAPENLTITGTTLSWDAVGNAENYVVYCNNSIFTTVSTNSCSLSSITTVGTYYLQVVATATGYTNSVKSEGITYSYGQLITPTGLSRVGNDLVWNSVTHATGYTVLCEELSQSWTTSTNSIDMASKLTVSGTYTLKVKATASGYADSDWSNSYSWQGGVQYFSVSVRRTDSDTDPAYIEIVVNNQATLLYYDDSATFTGIVGDTMRIKVAYPASGYTRQTQWSYSYDGGSDSGISINQDYYVEIDFTSNKILDVSYIYVN